MYVVTKPLWDWYTDQTTHCKTPEDALRYNIDMAKSWRSASQIRLTFEHSLYDSQALQYCLGLLQSEQQIQKSVHGLMSLSWAISSERLWSFAARHCTPLDCYADFLSQDHLLALLPGCLQTLNACIHWMLVGFLITLRTNSGRTLIHCMVSQSGLRGHYLREMVLVAGVVLNFCWLACRHWQTTRL